MTESTLTNVSSSHFMIYLAATERICKKSCSTTTNNKSTKNVYKIRISNIFSSPITYPVFTYGYGLQNNKVIMIHVWYDNNIAEILSFFLYLHIYILPSMLSYEKWKNRKMKTLYNYSWIYFFVSLFRVHIR